MKPFLIILLTLVALNLSAQQTNAPIGTPLRVYKTYADVMANKPVDGIEVTNDETKVGRKKAMALKENGTEKTITAEEFPYYAYTDKSGLFIRPSDGKFYYVLVLGKFSYYFCTCEGHMSTSSKGELIGISSNPDGRNFYSYTSDGPEGKIEDLKQTIKQVLKDEPELLKGFSEEVPKRGFPGFTESAEREVRMKYLKLYNEKKAKG